MILSGDSLRIPALTQNTRVNRSKFSVLQNHTGIALKDREGFLSKKENYMYPHLTSSLKLLNFRWKVKKG